MSVNINEFLKAYCFFDNKGRQLSIYGKFVSNTSMLTIYVLTLNSGSKKTPAETFNKKKADQYFIDYLGYREGDEAPEIKPLIFSIRTTPESFRNSFLRFAEENYFRKTTINIQLTHNKVIKVDNYFNENHDIDRIDNKSLKIVHLSDKQAYYLQQMIGEHGFSDDNDFNLNKN